MYEPSLFILCSLDRVGAGRCKGEKKNHKGSDDELNLVFFFFLIFVGFCFVFTGGDKFAK